jgi:uncharacterized membrane protein
LSQLFEPFLSLVSAVPGLRAVLAVILIFFLPGFAWTLVLFPRVNLIERITLSIALSIALITLSIIVLFYLFGIKITGTNSVIVMLLITALGAAAYAAKRLLLRRQVGANED